MSISASIDLVFDREVSPVTLIETLINFGWSVNDNGHISYLPLSDDDQFDWEWCDINRWSSVLSILTSKAALKETVGLALTWEDSNIGGEILILSDGRNICFSLTSNRKEINNNSYTDFSWYLGKIIEPLCRSGFYPVKIECEHLR